MVVLSIRGASILIDITEDAAEIVQAFIGRKTLEETQRRFESVVDGLRSEMVAADEQMVLEAYRKDPVKKQQIDVVVGNK